MFRAALATAGAHETPLRRAVPPILHQEHPERVVWRTRYRRLHLGGM